MRRCTIVQRKQKICIFIGKSLDCAVASWFIMNIINHDGS